MIIYKTTNLIDNKIYIGKDVKNKPSYLGSGKLLKLAIKKYGKHNFSKIILEDNIWDKDILSNREIYWINYYNSTDRNIGYNLTLGGTGGDVISNNIDRENIVKTLGFRKNQIPWNKGKEGLRGEKNGNFGNPSGFKGNKTSFKLGKDHTGYGKKQSAETINKRIQSTDYKKRSENFPWEQKAKKCMKPILEIDKNGDIIKEWESISTASRILNIPRHTFYNAINNNKELNNSFWLYKYKNDAKT